MSILTRLAAGGIAVVGAGALSLGVAHASTVSARTSTHPDAAHVINTPLTEGKGSSTEADRPGGANVQSGAQSGGEPGSGADVAGRPDIHSGANVQSGSTTAPDGPAVGEVTSEATGR